MHLKLPFSKYSGCGNEFVLLDNRNASFPTEDQGLIIAMCHRRKGIGADGVILLENSSKADFKMRIFNADGGEAEMCGNGIRCLFKFIDQLTSRKDKCRIETQNAIVQVEREGELVHATMPPPENIQWDVPLSIENQIVPVHFMNTGVPHAVLFVEDLDNERWMNLAPKIRRHPFFSPEGTNVNFAFITPQQDVNIRTYERGVEGETSACGTGAVAVALAAACLYDLASPVRMLFRSQESLEIRFKQNKSKTNRSEFYDVHQAGLAKWIFNGEWILH
jgi:diaminopimelate epimerase